MPTLIPPPAVLPAAVFVAAAAAAAAAAGFAAAVDADAAADAAAAAAAAAAAGSVLVSRRGLFSCEAGRHGQLPLPYRHHICMFAAESVLTAHGAALRWCWLRVHVLGLVYFNRIDEQQCYRSIQDKQL